MSVLTHSQSNPEMLAKKSLLNIETSMNELIESFPKKRAIQQKNLLSKFMNDNNHLFELTIKYFANAKDANLDYLRIFTIIHNQMLSWKISSCSFQVFSYLKKYLLKTTIYLTSEGRISGYNIDGKYVDFKDCLC